MSNLDMSSISYTNLDFGSIYPDLLDLAKTLSNEWDPSASNESDPGVVLLKEAAFVGDHNNYHIDKNTLAHAELAAIRKASKKTGDWRLEDCTMYVTLEPCQMCAGAIVQSRMKRVVIASMNAKAGCAGSVLNLLQMQQFNHQVEITQGVLEEECSRMLSSFFRELRERKKQAAQPAET